MCVEDGDYLWRSLSEKEESEALDDPRHGKVGRRQDANRGETVRGSSVREVLTQSANVEFVRYRLWRMLA